MFDKGGHTYVYLIYGMHYLFNVVTNRPDVTDAVLIRAIEPLEGVEIMKARQGKLTSPISSYLRSRQTDQSIGH